MNEKTYLVTGAAGFIGYHLCKSLLEQNINVVGIDNLNDYYIVELKNDRLNNLKKYKNFIFYRCDISNKDELINIFKTVKPRIVINLAAQAGVRYSIENPDSYIQSNLIGFFNILESCRNYKVDHLVFASSSSVYGNNKKVPFSTSDMVDKPVSLYAATKKADELMAYAYSNLYNIAVTGLRFFTVYGPYGRPDMAYFSFTNNIKNNKVIKVFNNGDMYRDFTYIDDIVEGINLVINKIPIPDEFGVRYKIYNIGNNKPVRISKFISILEKEIGKCAEKEYLPMQDGDVYETYADIDDLIMDTGFKPKTSIEEGLKKFVDWHNNYYV
jgi:UDP-glucuronate 4-epimerase